MANFPICIFCDNNLSGSSSFVEAVGPIQSEALDNYREQLDGLEDLIEEVQPLNAADYAVIIGNHWNRVVLASLDRALGGLT